MATRRKNDQDRPMMDMSGSAKQAPSVKDFLAESADDDRKDAKAKHLDKALKSTKEMIGQMQKAVAHGQSSEDDAMKRACLEEIATIGNAARDAARAGIRASENEKRNVQN